MGETAAVIGKIGGVFMATVPKRRHSKTRQRKGLTHWKLEKANLMVCPKCGEAKLPHRACLACGFYKGKAVIDAQ